MPFAVAPGGANDLFSYEPSTKMWKQLPHSSSAPSPRFEMGFAATPDRMLYVFGGCTLPEQGNKGGGTKNEWASSRHTNLVFTDRVERFVFLANGRRRRTGRRLRIIDYDSRQETEG